MSDDKHQNGYFGPRESMHEWEIHVPTPVGKFCVFCEEAIVEDDTGTISPTGQIMHYACQMRGIVGSVGHQRGTCSCHGGSEEDWVEDPIGMTRKQAAEAALKEWDGRPKR